MTKRLFDLWFSIIGLFFLSPFLILISICIKLDSKGPVFYRGARVGQNGKFFRIFKFRSMIVGAENKGASSTSLVDIRVTRMGKIIRKYKLDEFSQLINVFLGDMSLVGPRPEVKKFTDMYDDDEKMILSVRPGITDYASIKFHNEGEIIAASGIVDADEAYAKLIRPEKIRLQIKYINERNILLDFRLILLTILQIIKK